MFAIIAASIEARIVAAAIGAFLLHITGHDAFAFPIDAVIAIAAAL